MSITFSRTIPILRIFDVAKAKEFYLDFLGFHLDWEHRFEPGLPVYMQVSRGGLVLHLSEHHGDDTPGSAVFVVLDGVSDLHREISSKQYKYPRPGIERVPWNANMMTIADPFGNHLRLNEYLKAPATGTEAELLRSRA